MIKKHSTMLALTGVAILAAGGLQAQDTSFTGGDLLLDFRNASTASGSDVTVDLGNITAFVATVSQYDGGTAVLDSGSGYSASSFLVNPAFSGSSLISLLGTPSSDNEIGFSAAASDHTASSSGTGLLYLTRTQSSASLTPPATPSQQQGLSAQSATSSAIYNIGFGSESGTTLSGSSFNAAVVASGNPSSYQSQGQANVNEPQVINYGGSQNTANGAGGKLESLQTGAGTVYEALWAVPVSGNGPDTYQGYFAFSPDGEATFTAAVPEAPTSAGLIIGLGVLALACRRQFAFGKA